VGDALHCSCESYLSPRLALKAVLSARAYLTMTDDQTSRARAVDAPAAEEATAITNLKSVEDLLREAQARTESVLASVAAGHLLLDHQWRYLYVNDAAVRAIGRPREQILGCTLWELYPDIIGTELDRQYHRAMDERVQVSFDFHYETNDTWWENRFCPAPEGLAVFAIDITTRKQTNERLREYEKVVEGLEEMIVVVDRDYRYLIANRAFLNYRDLKRDQVIGHLVSEFLDHAAFEIVRQKLDECFQGNVVRYEFRCPYPNLGERDLFLSYFPIEGPGGVNRAACIFRDITEQKRAEKALRKAEQKYRDIFENAGEGIFQTTPEGQYLEANPALVRMHGFDSTEELIRNLKDISQEVYIDPAHREEFKQLLETRGFVRGFEHQIFRRDRSKIWVSVNARVVRDDRGEVLYYEGTAQDINERKLAEARSAAFAALARKLSGTTTPLAAGRIIADTAQELFGWDTCNLDLYDADHDLVHPILNVDTIAGRRVDITATYDNLKPTARARRVIDHGPELQLREDPICFDKDVIPFGDTLRPSASIITVPVRHASRIVGMLSIQSYTPRAYDFAALSDLQSLAEHCGEALNRIHAEESFYESEERFRQMAEHFEDVVWLTDKNISKILYINPAYERTFRRTCESVYERLESLVEAVHPEDRAGVKHALESERKGDYAPVEYRILWPDGSVRWILRRSFPMRNTEGEVNLVAGIAQDITDRKRAQEALRESEERYRDLVENSGEFICTHDLNGVILSANRAAVTILGYDPKDYVGRKNFRDLLAPEVRDQFGEYLARIRRDGFANGLTLVQTSSGERRVWEYHNTLRTDGVASPIVRGMARDVTERRQAEALLKISERKYRDIVSFAPVGIYQSLLNGTLITANQALAKMLGCDSVEELLKLNLDSDVYLVAGERRNLIARHERKGKAIDLELQWKRKDGSTFWVQLNWHAVKRPDGVTEYFEGFVREITEERRAKEALRESEERYRELFENSKDAIYVHDLSGRYVSLNRAAEKLSGFSRDEIIGRHFSNFVAPRDLKQARTNLCKKLDLEGETTYEIDLVTKDRRRVPVEVVSRLIYENGRPVGVQGTARDITERKRAQEALQIYSRRLIEAQEAERQSLARELHDEIGQVLTAVRINLQTVQNGCQTEACLPNIEESIVIVDEALTRIRELSLELRPSLLDDLGLAAALRWYVDRYGQRTGIAAEVLNGFEESGRLPRDLETECFRIAQEALTNVARHAQASRVSVQLEARAEKLVLTIKDNGTGFDTDNLLKSASSASTLGLRGMKERALAMNGHVEIESALGKGTHIRATFPLKRRN
jgi:PAS domain S-box-containing protein